MMKVVVDIVARLGLFAILFSSRSPRAMRSVPHVPVASVETVASVVPVPIVRSNWL